MTIVCGTDFSEDAVQAGRAAAALARRMGTSVSLVHVIDELGAELIVGGPNDSIYEPLRTKVEAQAQALHEEFHVAVLGRTIPGVAHEQLVATAQQTGAQLIVVASLGKKRKTAGWLLGSVAERVAQMSPLPVLVLRDAAPLLAWASGQRKLRVIAGVELASTSKAALRWAHELKSIGPRALQVTQVAWPVGEHHRVGAQGPLSLDRLRPELEEILLRDLRSWASDVPGDDDTSFVVSPGLGRVDNHLSLLAEQSGADLLVLGTSKRALGARLWQGSTSRGVLSQASCNVACVPRSESAASDLAIATFRRVLVPTDFSPLSYRALSVGYGLVAKGGIVHLMHVVTHKPGEDDPTPHERLHALTPAGAAARAVTTEVEVVRMEDAGLAIAQAATRLGVDAICMATHGRTGLPKMVLGSQAQAVVQRAQVPVMLVPPERST